MSRRTSIGHGTVALLSVVLALGGCGGGGGGSANPGPVGGGGPLPLSSANYTTATQESVASALYLSDSTSLLVGAQVAGERMLFDMLLATVDRLPHWLAMRPKFVTGVTQTDSEACDGGGRLDFTVEDLNGNDDADVGDSARVVAVDCVVDGVTANGTVSAVFTAVSGSFGTPPYSATLALTFENFSAASAAGQVTGSGRFDLTASSNNVNSGSLAISAATFTLESTMGSTSSTRTLSNFSLSSNVTTSGSVTSTSTTVAGTLSSTALGAMSVTISTVNPLVTAEGDAYPSSGQILVSGAGNSKARLTVQNASSVLIELDADGNGSYEVSTVVAWSDIA